MLPLQDPQVRLVLLNHVTVRLADAAQDEIHAAGIENELLAHLRQLSAVDLSRLAAMRSLTIGVAFDGAALKAGLRALRIPTTLAWECEDGTNGTDTLDAADATASGGNVAQFTPTGTAAAVRSTIVLCADPGDVAALQGEHRLYLAVKDNADLISTNVGDLETLTTTDKSSLVNATNEVKNLVDTIPAGPKGDKGDTGEPGTSLSLKVNRQYDTYEDLPVSADIGYMCLVGFNLHIFTENGWVNAGELTEIDLDLYAHIDGGLFTDESGVEIGESGLEALQSHIIDANTHTNLIVDGTEV